MSTRLLLAGYFGCGNLGDDAILVGFASCEESRKYELAVLSGSPEETYRNYGLSAVPRRDGSAIAQAIDRCDALVFPGGSVFQDSTSVMSVKYYSDLVSRAKKAGKKVIMLGQGVGPLTSFFGKQMAVKAFNSADGIAVRDPASGATLSALGVRTPAKLTADLAFLLSKPSAAESVSSFQVGDMRAIGISARPPVKGKSREVVQIIGDVARRLFEAKLMPVLIELDREIDGPLILEIEKLQGGKIPDVRKLQTPTQLQERMSRMEGIIAMRLHAGILAATVGIAPFMVSYDPKVNALCTALELPAPLGLSGLTSARLFDNFMAFYKERERYQKTVERKRAALAEQALGNFDVLAEAVGAVARI